MLQPLSLTLEFARAVQAGDPFAFRFEPQPYLLRTENGGFQSADFPWDKELLDDLQALRLPKRDPALLQRVGERLQRFLVPLGLGELEPRILEAVRNGQRVLITIRSAAAELYALPWELCSLRHTGQSLGELPGTLLRYEWPETQSAPAGTALSSAGRIFFAWSAAAGAVPAAEHQAAIEKACRDSYRAFDLNRDILPRASTAGLSQALQVAREGKQPIEVLHLLCHGSPSGSTFGLALDDQSSGPGTTAVVDAGRLRQLLAPYADMVRLVVLCACESGNSGELGNQLGSIAQTLHRAGIAAVVASRFPLSVLGSIRLAEVLYQQLLAVPAPLEDALLQARQRLAEDESSLDWASVQLYARATDGEDTRPVLLRPYRGLLAFSAEHARFYHGRDREIAKMRSDLAALRKAGKPRLYVVTGASGTGKSSIVSAGLVPELIRDGEPWHFVRMRPGAAWEKTLASLCDADPGKKEEQILLLVDQFEELFTYTASPAERSAFVQRLWTLAGATDSRVTVIVTLRVDYLGACGELILDASGLRLDRIAYDEAHRLFLAQCTAEQLRSGISEPARQVGLQLEDGLEQRLLDDLGTEPGALPLLEYTLDHLWEQRQGRLLTQRAYDEMGGVSGALNQRADALVTSFSADQQQQARRLLVRLVETGEGSAPATRRRVELGTLRPDGSDAAARFEGVLAALVDARLLVRDSEGDKELLEVAHEALIRRWQRLKDWVAADRKMLTELEKVEGWAESCQKYDTLLVGNQLGYADEVQKSYRGELSERAVKLIAASGADRARQARAQRLGFAGLFALSLAALVAAGVAWRETQLAKQRLHQAIAVADQILALGEGRLRNVAGAAEARRDLLVLAEQQLAMLHLNTSDPSSAHALEIRRLTSQADLIFQNPRPSEGQVGEATRLYQEALAIAERELAKNPGSPRWQERVSYALDRLAGVLKDSGKLQEAKRYYERAVDLTQQALAANPNDTTLQHDLAVTYDSLGGIAETVGKIEEGRQHYEQALALRTKLARLDPKNMSWQISLAISHSKLGSVCKDTGKLQEAQQHYERALALAKTIADADPSNTKKQSTLGDSYGKLGGVLETEGKPEDARKYYEQGMAIDRKLVATDPGNTEWRRNLTISLRNIGGVLEAMENLEAAKAHYEEALAITKELAQSDPSNTEWQRDLAIGLSDVAGMRYKQSNPEGARAYYEEALAIDKKLADSDPTNAQWQRDVSLGYESLATVLLDLGKNDEAQRYLEQDLAIAEKLAESDPGNTQWQRDLAVGYLKLAPVLVSAGKPEAAEQRLEQALVLSKKLGAADPVNLKLQRDLLALYSLLILTNQMTGHTAELPAHMAALAALVERFEGEHLFTGDSLLNNAKELLGQVPAAKPSAPPKLRRPRHP